LEAGAPISEQAFELSYFDKDGQQVNGPRLTLDKSGSMTVGAVNANTVTAKSAAVSGNLNVGAVNANTVHADVELTAKSAMVSGDLNVDKIVSTANGLMISVREKRFEIHFNDGYWAFQPDGNLVKYSFVRDKNGNLVKDKDGNPMRYPDESAAVCLAIYQGNDVSWAKRYAYVFANR
jgi:hypothetical protein